MTSIARHVVVVWFPSFQVCDWLFIILSGRSLGVVHENILIFGRQVTTTTRVKRGMKGRRKNDSNAHLAVQLVHPPNGLVNSTGFKSVTNEHPFLNAFDVDTQGQASLGSKLDGGIAIPFDDQVIEDDLIEFTAQMRSACQPIVSFPTRRKRRWRVREQNV